MDKDDLSALAQRIRKDPLNLNCQMDAERAFLAWHNAQGHVVALYHPLPNAAMIRCLEDEAARIDPIATIVVIEPADAPNQEWVWFDGNDYTEIIILVIQPDSKHMAAACVRTIEEVAQIKETLVSFGPETIWHVLTRTHSKPIPCFEVMMMAIDIGVKTVWTNEPPLDPGLNHNPRLFLSRKTQAIRRTSY